MKTHPQTQLTLVAALLALAGIAGGAQATPLATPQPPIPFDILANAPGGTLLDSRESAVFAPTFTGTARMAVYDGPEAGVNLDFYYQFTNSPHSRDAIARLTTSDFAGFLADAFQTATPISAFFKPGQKPADTADRSANGTVIGFNFYPGGNPLNPGETSYTFIVRTDAQFYTDGTMGIIDGSGTTTLSFAPVIPEPETYALMLAGLGLLGFAKRRKAAKPTASAPATGLVAA